MNTVVSAQTRNNEGFTPVYEGAEVFKALKQFANGEVFKILLLITDDNGNKSSITLREHEGEIVVYGSDLKSIQSFPDFAVDVMYKEKGIDVDTYNRLKEFLENF